MINVILKQFTNNEWREVSKSSYQVGQIIRANNGNKYKITQISGSKITLEEINYLAKSAKRGNING